MCHGTQSLLLHGEPVRYRVAMESTVEEIKLLVCFNRIGNYFTFTLQFLLIYT